ncbi:MAG: hypothetical protein AAGI88_15820 [Pseudomonadota bacterium]
MQDSLVRHRAAARQDTLVEIRETAASWVLEGGQIMPESGEKDAWFAAKENRHQATAAQRQ